MPPCCLQYLLHAWKFRPQPDFWEIGVVRGGAARGLEFADKSSETHQDEDQIYCPSLMGYPGGGKGLFSSNVWNGRSFHSCSQGIMRGGQPKSQDWSQTHITISTTEDLTDYGGLQVFKWLMWRTLHRAAILKSFTLVTSQRLVYMACQMEYFPNPLDLICTCMCKIVEGGKCQN